MSFTSSESSQDDIIMKRKTNPRKPIFHSDSESENEELVSDDLDDLNSEDGAKALVTADEDNLISGTDSEDEKLKADVRNSLKLLKGESEDDYGTDEEISDVVDATETSSVHENIKNSFQHIQTKKIQDIDSDSESEDAKNVYKNRKTKSNHPRIHSDSESEDKIHVRRSSKPVQNRKDDYSECASNKSEIAVRKSINEKSFKEIWNKSDDYSESESDDDELVEDSFDVLKAGPKHSERECEEDLKSKLNETGFVPRQSLFSSTRVELNDDSETSSIVEISSDEDKVEQIERIEKQDILKQTTIPELFLSDRRDTNKNEQLQSDNPLIRLDAQICSESEYELQETKVRELRADLYKCQTLCKKVDPNALPDKGRLLFSRLESLKTQMKQEEDKLMAMKVPDRVPASREPFVPQWKELDAAAAAIQPKTFGKRAIQTLTAEKALTMDKLHQLHGSLQARPDDNVLADDPEGLKVELMRHQKRALAWIIWRESQKPSGGILADDMGLGKTLTMISVVLKQKNDMESDNDDSDEENQPTKVKGLYPGGTLVVCPASLLNQWSGEIERRTKRGVLSFEVHHGTKRETKAKRLAKYDVVVTTYSIVQNECARSGTVFGVKWRRIILDEAHQVRNPKSQTSEAVCQLSGKCRWALTGTPVHNKELDLYALLKFLRCSPFDDLRVWKRWVSDKTRGGQERLNTVISSILLRRTKVELESQGQLSCLPEKNWELIEVALGKDEMQVYQKILIFSRTLFAQYLHQHAQKSQGRDDYVTNLANPNQEYYKMHQKLIKMRRAKEVKSHEILVLLLRLRQICCHPALINSMLQDDNNELEGEEIDSDEEDINLLDQLNNLNLEDNEPSELNSNPLNINNEEVNLSEATRGILRPSHPVFQIEHQSSKIKATLIKLKEILQTDSDKAIVVSQWTSLLNIIAKHLRSIGIQYGELNGTIPVQKRMEIVDKFNDARQTTTRVLLLSLTAGGVGLNLIGANHLILLDLHWNPQLEMQAQDRIYRVGQDKPVFVYKFMAVNTIEERIKQLQEQKLQLAEACLTGSKMITNKLSINDLKMLFNM